MRILRRRRRAIDPGLARVIAAQVGAGLVRNPEPVSIPDDPVAALGAYAQEVEEASARARGALVAIGLMVGNADADAMAMLEDLERLAGAVRT